MRPVAEVQTKEDLYGIIAAKDAEIAELNKRIDTLIDQRNEASALQFAEMRKHDVTKFERDEARECARMLCGALRDIGAYSDEGASGKLAMTGNYAWFDEPASVRKAREALAATPEHLRNA